MAHCHLASLGRLNRTDWGWWPRHLLPPDPHRSDMLSLPDRQQLEARRRRNACDDRAIPSFREEEAAASTRGERRNDTRTWFRRSLWERKRIRAQRAAQHSSTTTVSHPRARAYLLVGLLLTEFDKVVRQCQPFRKLGTSADWNAEINLPGKNDYVGMNSQRYRRHTWLPVNRRPRDQREHNDV